MSGTKRPGAEVVRRLDRQRRASGMRKGRVRPSGSLLRADGEWVRRAGELVQPVVARQEGRQVDRPDFERIARPSQEVALTGADAEVPDQIELLGRLDALRDDPRAPPLRELLQRRD